jgi:hypothetical protein
MLSFLKEINPELKLRAKLINRVLCYPVILTEVQAFVHTSLKWLTQTNNLIALFPDWKNKGDEPPLDEMLKDKIFNAFLNKSGLDFDYEGFKNLNKIANFHKHKEFQIIDFEDAYTIYTFLFTYSANLYTFIKKTKPKEDLISKDKFRYFYRTIQNMNPYDYVDYKKRIKSQKAEITRLKKIIKEKI